MKLRILRKLWRLFGPNDFTRTIGLGIFSLLMVMIGVTGFLHLLSTDLPDLDQLKQYEPQLITRILDRNGELLTEMYAQRRLRLSLDQIPQHTIDAILTTEDSRFFDHWGLDIVRIFGAAIVDITSMSTKQGASTITQQLARDLFLHKRRTFTRKIRETLTALQIERHYSKQEILEMYLTQIYFGHGAYGVQTASQLYFNKPATELTLAESATLAALPKSPSHYSPFWHPKQAIKRRNLVLMLMRNQGVISDSLYITTISEPLNTVRGTTRNSLGTGPYFTEMIRQTLSEEGEQYGFNYLTDGITIHSTLDARLQRFAEAAVDSHMIPFQSAYRQRYISDHQEEIDSLLEKGGVTLDSLIADSINIDERFAKQAIVQVALVVLDPHSGDILAMIGGVDFSKYKFNRAVQAIRQPGSVFKPIVYTTAIDNGYPPSFEILNTDIVLTMLDGTRWVPYNYDRSRGGKVTLREALRRSLNLASARLVQDVVPPRMVVDYAKRFGISTKIDAVDAIALGASGVIPLDMTAAFGVFASGGIYYKPRSVISIEDRFGTVLTEYSVNKRKRQALSPETAYIMTDMLRTVINRGTGYSVRGRWHFYHEAAGKTGTTNDYTDAWFIGFTPRLVCGVWVGLDDPAVQLGDKQAGSVAALPIWARFMKMTYDSLGWEDENFEMPPGVVTATICSETGKIATRYCPVKITDIFRRDMLPSDTCKRHQPRRGRL
ncbi:MAG: PBP1A family penicillin-binding protein [Candidatus Electryoneaceae bacterium]|nr:PBP1A family penicillin-binding protein [Candidatus Electryoneaceae bacterium]